jgi:GNAT superfamily N-acetyltransferase
MRRKGVARILIRHFEEWVKEKGQDIACISCTPHNLAMIMLARSEGYEILNMIEMRKNLTEKEKPRGEVEALGFKWKIL